MLLTNKIFMLISPKNIVKQSVLPAMQFNIVCELPDSH